jgi:hypothetical protein
MCPSVYSETASCHSPFSRNVRKVSEYSRTVGIAKVSSRHQGQLHLRTTTAYLSLSLTYASDILLNQLENCGHDLMGTCTSFEALRAAKFIILFDNESVEASSAHLILGLLRSVPPSRLPSPYKSTIKLRQYHHSPQKHRRYCKPWLARSFSPPIIAVCATCNSSPRLLSLHTQTTMWTAAPPNLAVQCAHGSLTTHCRLRTTRF